MALRWLKGGFKMDSEKLTITIGAVDLGKIDLLVEQGYYANRTDFIRTSIRNQLSNQSKDIDEIKFSENLGFNINKQIQKELDQLNVNDASFAGSGVFLFNKKDLEKYKKKNQKIKIKIIGMLSIANDVSPELVKETFEKVKVYGIIKASNEIKEILNNL